jgi:glucose/arabinose dehydrogenase
VAAAGSETPILELPALGATNHNGGAIHFDTDGKLYVGLGENAVPGNAQSLNTVLGKMLRINKDGSFPEDNPFYTQTTDNNKAIWAFELRNPYSFDVQPDTGRIFINDVAQNAWEEIDDGIADANYGWPIYEGPVKYMAHKSKKHQHKRMYTRSIFAYKHGSDETRGCAITGGAFYNPGTGVSASFPGEYEGDYFFADFCSGWIRRLDPTTNAVEGFKASSDENPVDLKVSQDGDLYFLARGTGSVEKIHFNG